MSGLDHVKRDGGHGENCACGACGGHGHEHHENHGNHENLDLTAAGEIGAPRVVCRVHDDARVVSGQLTLRGDAARVKAEVQARLGGMARTIAAMGGIVGHIKVSCETTTVDVYSVTDTEVDSRQSPEAAIRLNLAAIVFAIEPEDAEEMARQALSAVAACV
jgi:hypothetical protein